MDLLNTIKSICRFGLVTGKVDNSKSFATQQITYLGKVSDCAMLFPYGLYSHASRDDSLIAFYSMGGDEDNKLGMPYAPYKRPIDLQEGEVALYHPRSEASVKLRNNGDIEISTGNSLAGNVIINCADATINASNDVNIEAGNNVTIECIMANVIASTSMTFDTPLATFTSNVQIDGTLGVTGNFNLTGDASLGTGGLPIARTTDAINTTTNQITGGSSNHTAS